MYVIGADCIGCGACAGECPTGAIVDNGGVFKITDSCIDCGSCAGVCPVGCIKEG